MQKNELVPNELKAEPGDRLLKTICRRRFKSSSSSSMASFPLVGVVVEACTLAISQV